MPKQEVQHFDVSGELPKHARHQHPILFRLKYSSRTAVSCQAGWQPDQSPVQKLETESGSPDVLDIP
jgi:hypothetical protein